jgi:hypothetical protein
MSFVSGGRWTWTFCPTHLKFTASCYAETCRPWENLYHLIKTEFICPAVAFLFFWNLHLLLNTPLDDAIHFRFIVGYGHLYRAARTNCANLPKHNPEFQCPLHQACRQFNWQNETLGHLTRMFCRLGFPRCSLPGYCKFSTNVHAL